MKNICTCSNTSSLKIGLVHRRDPKCPKHGDPPPLVITIVGRVDEDMSREDSGTALIADLDEMETTTALKTGPDHLSDRKVEDSFFVRLQSSNKDGKHDTLESLRGKKIRVTIETIE